MSKDVNMSELRQDKTTKEWVIIAPERAKRPQDSSKKKHDHELPEREDSCPFCPGNEKQTPKETYRLSKSIQDASWAVRVVPNRFSALSPNGDSRSIKGDTFFRKRPGFGVHEVIIESPLHNAFMALMEYEQIEKIIHTYRQRYNTLKKNKQINFITIFKNHGIESGTSLMHPHSQLVATPITTPYYHKRLDVADDYYADVGSCLYCDLLMEELANNERVVAETDQFVVLHPFASRVPWETWIMPKVHHASFGVFPQEHIAELAIILKDVLYCLHQELHNPAFNMMIDTSITSDEENPYYHWHIRILPRLSMIAGFEIGSGIYITTAMPEETTQLMRKCCLSYNKLGAICLLPPVH
jgi:UDPglucose--hexose-1-phosphate uridylyltransferase